MRLKDCEGPVDAFRQIRCKQLQFLETPTSDAVAVAVAIADCTRVSVSVSVSVGCTGIFFIFLDCSKHDGCWIKRQELLRTVAAVSHVETVVWYGMVWLILNYAVVIQRKGLFIRYGDDWVDELDMPDFCILYVTTDDVVRSTG